MIVKEINGALVEIDKYCYPTYVPNIIGKNSTVNDKLLSGEQLTDEESAQTTECGVKLNKLCEYTEVCYACGCRSVKTPSDYTGDITDYDYINGELILNAQGATKKTAELIAEKKAQLNRINEDLLQVQAGLVVPNIDDKKREFQTLLNEVRALEGKEPRGISIAEEVQ